MEYSWGTNKGTFVLELAKQISLFKILYFTHSTQFFDIWGEMGYILGLWSLVMIVNLLPHLL